MAPGDECQREVEHGEVGVGALLPADQDAAEAVEPGMGALDHPAPGLGAGLPFGRDLLAAGTQVQGEAELGREVADLVVVLALWTSPLGMEGSLTNPSTQGRRN